MRTEQLAPDSRWQLWTRSRSDVNDVYQLVESLEGIGIAGVERKTIRECCRCNQGFAGSLVRVLGGVRSRGELGHRDCADRRLDGKVLGVEACEVDDDGRCRAGPVAVGDQPRGSGSCVAMASRSMRHLSPSMAGALPNIAPRLPAPACRRKHDP